MLSLALWPEEIDILSLAHWPVQIEMPSRYSTNTNTRKNIFDHNNAGLTKWYLINTRYRDILSLSNWGDLTSENQKINTKTSIFCKLAPLDPAKLGCPVILSFAPPAQNHRHQCQTGTQVKYCIIIAKLTDSSVSFCLIQIVH